MLDPGKNIPKKITKKFKNKKTSFWLYFWSNWDWIDQEREKKILVPNFVLTQSCKENSEKNIDKIQKLKKPLSGIIFSQHG